MDWNLLMFYMNTGGLVMWIIAGLSLLGTALVLERIIFFKTASRKPVIFQIEKGEPFEKSCRIGEHRIQNIISDWERNLSFLEVIIRLAPMLGLLGTVLGMVQMFQALAEGGAVTAAAVTNGIREALFTTVAGLSCAIPLMLAYGFLLSWIERQEDRLHNLLEQALSGDECSRA